MQIFDTKADYDQMDEGEKRKYLELVQQTKMNVKIAVEQTLAHPDIRTGVLILRENISSLISELMMYVAGNDVVGFSMNPGTDLRHTLIGLSKGLSAIEFIFTKGNWFNEDETTGRIEGMRPYTPLEQDQIARELLQKRLIQLKS